MISASGRHVRSLVLLTTGILLSGCAGTLPDVDPADVPRLEREVARTPGNAGAKVRLGMAQFKAGRYDEARGNLRAAVTSGHESGAALLYLGMVEEELQDWSASRDAYNRYLTAGASGATRDAVRDRLTLIGRHLMRAETRQALTRGTSATLVNRPARDPMSDTRPQYPVVAVLPLAVDGTDPELEPLVHALADLMVADFRRAGGLTVVDRARTQTVLDEMALDARTRGDRSEGERAGRLLGADFIVQGVLRTASDGEVRVAASVVEVGRPASADRRISESSPAGDPLSLEKEIVVRSVREILDIPLTSAREKAIRVDGADDVAAVVAYGRGLRAMDRGRYVAAQEAFAAASALDPGGIPGMHAAMREATLMAAASRMSTEDLATLASTTGETRSGFVAPPSAATTDDLSSLGIASRAPVGLDAGTAPPSVTPALRLGTLRSVTEAVAPTPTALTLGLSSAEEIRNPAAKQTLATTREPLQEALSSVALPGLLQLEILMSTVRVGAVR